MTTVNRYAFCVPSAVPEASEYIQFLNLFAMIQPIIFRKNNTFYTLLDQIHTFYWFYKWKNWKFLRLCQDLKSKVRFIKMANEAGSKLKGSVAKKFNFLIFFYCFLINNLITFFHLESFFVNVIFFIFSYFLFYSFWWKSNNSIYMVNIFFNPHFVFIFSCYESKISAIIF